MVDLWFFDQNIGFWKWGMIVFVIGIIFIFQVLVFVTTEINGFLIFGNGVCLFLTLLSYITFISPFHVILIITLVDHPRISLVSSD